MATAHQLYPLTRLADMDDQQLRSVLRFALDDAADTNHTCVYDGMDRASTVATARRTIDDVNAHINYRAAMAFDRQATLDLLHAQALKEYEANGCREPFTLDEVQAEDALDEYMRADPNA